MVKVSVIIPVYNVEPYLKQCMDSVVGQTLKDIEIICVDDGSTDNSLDILREYQAAHSDMLIISDGNNMRACASFLYLIRTYTDDNYFALADQDDIWDADKLIIGIKAIQKLEDDDENIPVYSLKDVEGTYSGKMQTTSIAPLENAENEAEDGVTVNAELKDNHILISKFPVEDLIKSIIEDPDAAEAIIKAVGDVEYKIPYQAAFNDNKDNILLQMSPEPLVLEIAMELQPIRKTEGEEETPKLTVKVTIKADEKGSYAYEGQKLKFAIQATEVTVNEERFDKFPATTFTFDMTKK